MEGQPPISLQIACYQVVDDKALAKSAKEQNQTAVRCLQQLSPTYHPQNQKHHNKLIFIYLQKNRR